MAALDTLYGPHNDSKKWALLYCEPKNSPATSYFYEIVERRFIIEPTFIIEGCYDKFVVENSKEGGVTRLFGRILAQSSKH